MIIRRCKYEDILSVSELEKLSFKGECWGFGTLASAFENSQYSMFVAEDDGEIAGYGCISVSYENCDLENVLVAEEYRRSGVGRRILNELIQEAKSRGAENMFLEVRVSNSPAMRLYLSAGFVGVYTRSRYYSDGEDCLVMKKSLN